jgi:hypothetical protein
MPARPVMPPTSHETLRVSNTLVAAVKLAAMPAYEIAARAGLRPEVLSKLLHGALPLRPRDRRVLGVARVVGVRMQDAFAIGDPARARLRRRRVPFGGSCDRGTGAGARP